MDYVSYDWESCRGEKSNYFFAQTEAVVRSNCKLIQPWQEIRMWPQALLKHLPYVFSAKSGHEDR